MKTKGLSFMEAVEAMKRGCKVKNETCIDNVYYCMEKGNIMHCNSGECSSVHATLLTAFVLGTEGFRVWHIVEEPNKTLWDKQTCPDDLIKLNTNYGTVLVYTHGDVKEALREFMSYFKIRCSDFHSRKAKEIFGEELIQ